MQTLETENIIGAVCLESIQLFHQSQKQNLKNIQFFYLIIIIKKRLKKSFYDLFSKIIVTFANGTDSSKPQSNTTTSQLPAKHLLPNIVLPQHFTLSLVQNKVRCNMSVINVLYYEYKLS